MRAKELIQQGQEIVSNKTGCYGWLLSVDNYFKVLNNNQYFDYAQKLIHDCQFFTEGSRMQIQKLEQLLAVLQQLECLENDNFTQQHIYEPLMRVFNDTRLSYAEKEFNEAIIEYNAKRYKQAITGVCQATESAMKAIYLHKTGAQAQGEFGPLVNKMDELGLVPIQNMLLGYSKTRNESIHGTDAWTYEPSDIDAMFEINRFASLILFLYQKSGMGDDIDG